jgi:hypothetical protein
VPLEDFPALIDKARAVAHAIGRDIPVSAPEPAVA